MNLRKGIVLVVIALLIAAFFLFDVGGYLTLENLKSQQESLVAWQQAKPWQSALVFLVYVVVTALSLPGATIMTLAIGRFSGCGQVRFWSHLPLQSALPLAFIIARFLLRDTVQARFGDKLGAINQGIEKDGAFTCSD